MREVAIDVPTPALIALLLNLVRLISPFESLRSHVTLTLTDNELSRRTSALMIQCTLLDATQQEVPLRIDQSRRALQSLLVKEQLVCLHNMPAACDWDIFMHFTQDKTVVYAGRKNAACTRSAMAMLWQTVAVQTSSCGSQTPGLLPSAADLRIGKLLLTWPNV